MSFIEFKDVVKEYRLGDNDFRALNNCNFEIEEGELVVIVGPSGAGKTTALNILGGMDVATEGTVTVKGKTISDYNKDDLVQYRRNDIGFVFQFYNLIQNLTALENVELAAEICSNPMDSGEALKKVGLFDKLDNFPAQLSGGEQQRVAIARAIVKNPGLLLCDEPTGALDYETGKQVLSLLQETCYKDNMTVVIVTHNQALIPMADRVIMMKNGEAIETVVNEEPELVENIEW